MQIFIVGANRVARLGVISMLFYSLSRASSLADGLDAVFWRKMAPFEPVEKLEEVILFEVDWDSTLAGKGQATTIGG